MALTLRVSSFQGASMGADAIRVFDHGGTIGRSPENDWVLPDPERFVSARHAEIRFEGGAYVLTDCSTNGTSVNGRELTKGARVQLGSGDVVTIGSYEISVLVESALGMQPQRDAAPFAPSSPSPAASPFDAFLEPSPEAMVGGEGSVDPLDFFADRGNVELPREPASTPNHSPAYSDFFSPPPVSRDPALADPGGADARPAPSNPSPQSQSDPPPQPAVPSGADLIPENWDETSFSTPSEAGGARAADADSSASSTMNAAPRSVPEPTGRPGVGEPSGRTDASEPSGAENARPSSGAENARPSSGAYNAPGPSGAEAAGRGTAVSASDVGALLAAAGIDPAQVSADTLASLGEVLRVVVDGLMDVLRARAEIKNQFRVPMTTLKPVENNPLKFSANAEDALFNLFARRSQSFKAPVEAFKEAFDDLRAHQVATMAGMRAAFTALMARFDPDRLQEGFDRGLKRGALLEVMNKTKYWDLYREMYEALGDDDVTFRRLFGDEFAQAYEEQMQRITALQRRK